MKIAKVEKILKTKAAATNRRKTKDRAEHGVSKWNEAIEWTDALSLPWQKRNQRFKGCNGKCILDPVSVSATSYGHWEFVRKIKGKVVFNAYRYSTTTNGHQSTVRGLLRDLGIKIDLEVNTRASLSDFNFHAALNLYRDLYTAEIASKRARIRPDTLKALLNQIKALKRDIALARKLGAKASKVDLDGVRAECVATETRRLAELASKREHNRTVARASRVMLKTNQVADLSQLSAA